MVLRASVRRVRPLLVAGLLMAASGDNAEAGQIGASPTDEGSGAPPATVSSAAGAKVAFLSASSANAFLQASVEAIEGVADDNDIDVTIYDAQFDSALQLRQLQDVTALGSVDGIILNSVGGPEMIPAVEEAIDAGIKVVILNQIVGLDLDTPDPQIDGVSASIVTPPSEDGKRLGELAVMACDDLDPCNIVYWFGIKGIPNDDAVREGFDSVVGAHDNIAVVAEGEAGYNSPDESYAEMQDILTRNPDVHVVVGPDQGITGTELALVDAGVEFGAESGVRLIATGGSAFAFEAIDEGRWFGAAFAAPFTEGELAMEAMVRALTGGEPEAGIDAVALFEGNGIVTSSNVDEYEPQWAG